MASKVDPLTYRETREAAKAVLSRREEVECQKEKVAFIDMARQNYGTHAILAYADPDGVGDVIKRFDTMPSDSPASGTERVSLRRVYYYLRDTRTATGSDLSTVYGGSLSDIYGSAHEWHQTVVRPYAPFLPRVEYDGVRFRFDPDADTNADRPPAVAADGEVDDVNDVLDAVDVDDALPDVNADPHLARRNYHAVANAYAHLRDHGTASRADLRDHYRETTADVDGLYADAARGFRLVVAPVLRDLPGVDAPPVVGEDWRYVATDADRR